jgi:hypothetical protein
MEDAVKSPFFISREDFKIVFGSLTAGAAEKSCRLTFWQLHFYNTFDIIDLLKTNPDTFQKQSDLPNSIDCLTWDRNKTI